MLFMKPKPTVGIAFAGKVDITNSPHIRVVVMTLHGTRAYFEAKYLWHIRQAWPVDYFVTYGSPLSGKRVQKLAFAVIVPITLSSADDRDKLPDISPAKEPQYGT